MAADRWLLGLMVVAAACKTSVELSPAALPEATVGQPYRVEIKVTGNETPLAFVRVESGSLPPGLDLHFTAHEAPPVIEGTATQVGDYAFTLRVGCFGTNSAGQDGSRAYRIIVR